MPLIYVCCECGGYSEEPHGCACGGEGIPTGPLPDTATDPRYPGEPGYDEFEDGPEEDFWEDAGDE